MAGGDLRFGTTSMYMGVMYHKPAPSQRTKLTLHGYSVQNQLVSTHCRTTDFMHFGGKIQGELQASDPVAAVGRQPLRPPCPHTSAPRVRAWSPGGCSSGDLDRKSTRLNSSH